MRYFNPLHLTFFIHSFWVNMKCSRTFFEPAQENDDIITSPLIAWFVNPSQPCADDTSPVPSIPLLSNITRSDRGRPGICIVLNYVDVTVLGALVKAKMCLIMASAEVRLPKMWLARLLWTILSVKNTSMQVKPILVTQVIHSKPNE